MAKKSQTKSLHRCKVVTACLFLTPSPNKIFLDSTRFLDPTDQRVLAGNHIAFLAPTRTPQGFSVLPGFGPWLLS